MARIGAISVLALALFAVSSSAQTSPAQSASDSPYGGTTVEDIIARVNDQIISRSDYERAEKEIDQEGAQHNASPQEIAEAQKALLRNLIDQQLWLSKGKELGITGETELVKQLDEIRKKYNLDSMEDLEKAAKEQGVSFEDFKANIRNGIITQEVMRQEVGQRIKVTPGEIQRYFDAHKQDYAQPESVHLSEILVSVPAEVAPGKFGGPVEDPAKLAQAKAKAEDIEAKLKAGADFAQLAHTASDGPTSAQGGDLGQFRRGSLAKVLEDKTFALKAGDFTEPIRTKQGYVILKVTEHTPGGIPQYKDVANQVEESYYMAKMDPAIRAYLTKMREESYIEIKPGYVDSGASPKQTKLVYSSYTPPAAKKKKKAQRVRFRETAHGFRDKSGAASGSSAADTPATAGKAAAPAKLKKVSADKTTEKAGKKEKIRYGQAPRETLPSSSKETKQEDAGALPADQTANSGQEPANPLEQAAAPKTKTRYTARIKEVKAAKAQAIAAKNSAAPAAPGAEEVSDRATQSAPLGLGGNTVPSTGKKHKKKKATVTEQEKTRLQDKDKNKDAKPADTTAPSTTPAPAATPQS